MWPAPGTTPSPAWSRARWRGRSAHRTRCACRRGTMSSRLPGAALESGSGRSASPSATRAPTATSAASTSGQRPRPRWAPVPVGAPGGTVAAVPGGPGSARVAAATLSARVAAATPSARVDGVAGSSGAVAPAAGPGGPGGAVPPEAGPAVAGAARRAATAAAEDGRRSGSLASSSSMRPARTGAVPGQRCAVGGSVTVRCWWASATGVCPSYGGRPVSSAVSRQPSA